MDSELHSLGKAEINIRSGSCDVLPDKRTKCKICARNESKYTCPKCHVRYCSALCYKSKEHLQCSELFYKDCVFEEMKNLGSFNEESKRKIINALKACNDASDGTVEDVNEDPNTAEDLAERFKDVNLDDAERTWEKLNEKEREKFLKSLKGDELSFLAPWKPWWEIVLSKVHVISREAPDPDDVTIAKDLLESPIPISKQLRLSDFLKSKQPSPNIANDIINVLLTYAFVSRLYNGEFKDLVEQIVLNIIELSDVLAEGSTFEDIDHCLHSVFYKIQQCKQYSSASGLFQTTLKDVCTLLTRQGCTYSYPFPYIALLHIKDLLQKTHDQSHGKSVSEKKHRAILRKAVKKIAFYLMWLKEHLEDLYLRVSTLELKATNVLAHEDTYTKEKSVIEENLDKLRPSREPLIQEL